MKNRESEGEFSLDKFGLESRAKVVAITSPTFPHRFLEICKVGSLVLSSRRTVTTREERRVTPRSRAEKLNIASGERRFSRPGELLR